MILDSNRSRIEIVIRPVMRPESAGDEATAREFSTKGAITV